MVSSVERRRSKLPAVLAVVAAIGAAVAVYCITSSKRPLPAMPRASFDSAEIDAALGALRSRAQAFSPNAEERRLMDEVRSLHLSEVAATRGKEPQERSRGLLDTVRKDSVSLAGADRGRFVALGEKLAVAMQDEIEAFLEVGRRQGMEAALSQPSEALDRVLTAGGLFLFKALERGVVGERGELRGPRLLPEVLFRKRWCGAIGLEGEARFAPVEERALLDFTAVFTKDVDERLKAIDSLSRRDRSYDAEVARALVLLQAGRAAEAKGAVDRAVKAGRVDHAVEALREAVP
jgi:hypothetical protein